MYIEYVCTVYRSKQRDGDGDKVSIKACKMRICYVETSRRKSRKSSTISFDIQPIW